MKKETENTDEKTIERATDTQQPEKQRPIKKAEIAAFCVGLISEIFQNFKEDIEKQKSKNANGMPPSFFRTLDELIRLIELQNDFLRYLPNNWDQDIEERNIDAEFIESDEIANELLMQFYRRKMYFRNTGKIMEVQ